MQTGEVGVGGSREFDDCFFRVEKSHRLREGVVMNLERTMHGRRVLPTMTHRVTIIASPEVMFRSHLILSFMSSNDSHTK